jgi:hypothetical protein
MRKTMVLFNVSKIAERHFFRKYERRVTRYYMKRRRNLCK